MQPTTAAPHTATDTGAGGEAITPAAVRPAPSYHAARLRYLQAQLLRARAEENEHGALAAVSLAAGDTSDGDRHMLAALAQRDADTARKLADRIERDMADLVRLHPDAVLGIEPHAVVTITIRRDEITTRAMLCMGQLYHASHTESRSGRMFWRSTDADWIVHEEKLGTELVEFLESIDLPTGVANMLPRPATAAIAAAVITSTAATLRA